MAEFKPIRRCVSALLVNDEGNLVIQLRDVKPGLPFPAHWATLGGAIDDDETPDEAMRRELMEEIAQVLSLRFWRQIHHDFLWNGETQIVENYLYVGKLHGDLTLVKLHEGQRLGAFGPAEIETIPIAYGLETVFKFFFAAYDDDARLNL
jgi:8-oxo-dGTP diphosphatase